MIQLLRLPPFWFLVAVLGQFALVYHAPVTLLTTPRFLVGMGLVIAGIGLVMAVWAVFQRHRTPLAPFRQPEKLVTSGPFRFSRHPLYLGEVVMLLGLATLFGHWSAVLPVPLFALGLHVAFVRPEERMLEARFGESYRHYRSNVRCWL